MSQLLDRPKPSPAVLGVLQQCNTVLYPKLRRLLNPNVIDAEISVGLHFQAGVMNHLREADREPSYVAGLLECGEDNPLVVEVLSICLRTLRGRIEAGMAEGRHGVVTLIVEIFRGEATISSQADWVRKPNTKLA